MSTSENVIVLINGLPFAGWEKVEAERSYDEVTGEATVTVSPQEGNPMPVQLGDDAVVIFGTRPVVTGYVYSLDSGHGWDEHKWDVKIRDYPQDAVDSTLGKRHQNKPPVKLKTVVQNTLKRAGLKHIKVIDEVDPEQFEPTEVVVGDIDWTVFSFLDAWARKRQTVLTGDGKGNIVISRNQGKVLAGARLIKLQEDSPVNNVLSRKYSTSMKDRHGLHAAASRRSPHDKKYWQGRPKGDGGAQPGPMSKLWGVARDTAISNRRRMHFRSHQPGTGKTPKGDAEWRSNVAKARSFSYEATVQGFEAAPGVLWWPGFLIPVTDEHCQLADMLFIKSVKWSKEWEGGSKTVVTCGDKDSFKKGKGKGKRGKRSGKGGRGNPKPGSKPPAVWT